MIDIHNHILPGVDDGAKDMEQSVAMARIAEKDGITDIIATPHITDPYLTVEEINSRVALLNRELAANNIGVRIHAGAEIPFSMLDNRSCRIGLAGSKNLLVELPVHCIPSQAAKLFRFIKSEGYTVIIAHPERNMSVNRNVERLVTLLGPGVMAQITADSLIGRMGEPARACARYLVKKGAATFIATDAHNDSTRPPLLSPALSAIRTVKNSQAKKLVFDNPLQYIGLTDTV